MSQVPEHKRSFAAKYRRYFEAKEEAAKRPTEESPEKLAYYKGEPVIISVEGVKRYLYESGNIDTGSRVSPRSLEYAHEVGGIAVNVELESITGAINGQVTPEHADAVVQAA